MNTQEIVQRLWNLCHVLRDDGITYHQYVGSAEQVRAFFDEVDIRVGRAEERAMSARNRPAHGRLRLGDDDAYIRARRDRWAYRTLFDRTLLALLGYRGTYVDRATQGWPLRPLEERAGG